MTASGRHLTSSGRLIVAPIKSKRVSQLSNGESEVIDKGMVLPFEPLAMTFRHVNYYVPMPAVKISSHLQSYPLPQISLSTI